MKISEEQVWAYLTGELDEETARSVADAIAEDEALQQMAEEYRTLRNGLKQQRLKAYAAEAMAVIQEDDAPQKPKSGRTLWYVIAAVFLIGVLAWVMRPSTEITPAQIATNFFRLPADPGVAGNTNADQFNEGLDAFFTAQDYPRSIENWEAIMSDSLYGNSATYYLAHAYFLNQEYEKALPLLQNSSTAEDLFSLAELQDIRWNILVTRLILGEDIRAEVGQLPASAQRDDLLEALDQLPVD